jgi:hypothetical protein
MQPRVNKQTDKNQGKYHRIGWSDPEFRFGNRLRASSSRTRYCCIGALISEVPNINFVNSVEILDTIKTKIKLRGP